mmetsp:Transcript_53143/g.64030  ORF Transcript_53143/g.64030 Transcript_53143/m.64030 type:complete len:248 (+) Transcript_53143:77-820(+)
MMRKRSLQKLTVVSLTALLFSSINGFSLPSSKHALTKRNLSTRLAVVPGIDDSVITIATSASDLWTSYNSALETDPLITKSITAGVILGAADFAGQALEAKTKESSEETSIDFGRAARFAFFGFILQAPWNHFYYLLLDGALPPTDDPLTATTGIKVVIDQFVQAPIFTVIIFVFLGLLEGKNIESINKQLENDYKNTMVANWKLWVPATAVNIAFCPPLFRVLFLNCVFFFWSIYLSLTLNKEEEN